MKLVVLDELDARFLISINLKSAAGSGVGIGDQPICSFASTACVGAGPSQGIADAKGNANKNIDIKELGIVANILCSSLDSEARVKK
jgi:hypothetical protein